MSTDFSAFSDQALLALSQDSHDAMRELIKRHTRLVRACARPLFLAGGDHEDLVQEGMIGLLDAIRDYNPAASGSFPGFAALCIRRRMISAIRAASAQKHAPLNDSLSIESLPDLGTADQRDPELEIIGKEGFREFMDTLHQRLSPGERGVLELYLQGCSYQEIAARLNRSVKTVDNAVQRIRRKATNILGENGYPFSI